METPKNYKTQCRDLQVLRWESKLEPLPVDDPNFWMFDPAEGDLALVGEDEYVFSEDTWIKVETEEVIEKEEAHEED